MPEGEGALLVDVALAVPSAGTFQYSVPEGFRSGAEIGKRVSVSMRTRKMIGYLVGFSLKREVEQVKEIDSVIDPTPILSPELLELTRWMSEHYLCSWGQAIEAALPAPFRKGKLTMKSRAPKTAKMPPESSAEFPLTTDQDAAYRALSEATASGGKTFLLYGVTGSGKTEVYMHLIRDLVAQGRGAIVLVPEIALTPQAVDRFRSRFGDCLAVIHSRLTPAKRVEEWHRIRSGAAKIVVGARSAVFSPVQNLGLIVIDEEHDGSYKQDETPRYQTRDVAKKRIELEGATLLLGSATPSLEAFHAAEEGAVTRLDLRERIERRPLPLVDIVDMRRESEGKRLPVLSSVLKKALTECLEKKEQAMLLLNRRGFFTYLHCATCGHVMSCPNCRIALAYHFDKAALYCHACEHRTVPEKLCPACKKNYLHYFGMGTQKVESEVRQLFPQAKIGRMDADSTSRKDAHEHILTAFKNREIDVLVGTQMIAKGHDFPNVSLIGVVSADTALHIPDFRAAERTFDLLTQVAGRAGRGNIPGRVVIQTYVPHHYSIRTAREHDYDSFYKQETVFRRELKMPPYSRLIRIVITGAAEKDVVRQALTLAKLLEKAAPAGRAQVLGPAPCHVSREMGQYRWNLFLKAPDAAGAAEILKKAMGEFKKSQVTVAIDVDPQ